MIKLVTIRELISYAQMPESRRIGKTMAAVELAKSCDGMLICLDGAQARKLQKDHGINTCSVRSDDVRGYVGPIIFDQDALVLLCWDLLKIYDAGQEKPNKQIKVLKEMISDVDKAILLTDPDPDIRELAKDEEA